MIHLVVPRWMQKMAQIPEIPQRVGECCTPPDEPPSSETAVSICMADVTWATEMAAIVATVVVTAAATSPLLLLLPLLLPLLSATIVANGLPPYCCHCLFRYYYHYSCI